MRAKIFYSSIIIIVIARISLLLPQLPRTQINIHFARFALILILIVEIIKLFKYLCMDEKRNNWIRNIGLTATSLIVLLLVLETIFMFIPRTHGFDFTLSSKLWFRKYWHPINSYGYRDLEPLNNGKNTDVFFVGDSYTSGHGITNINDRFSNIVKAKFAKNGKYINSLNLGRNGMDTREEFERMVKFIDTSSIDPEYIVLQYYGNDIYNVAINNKLNFEGYKQYNELGYITQALVKGSYLINYLYWLFPRQDVNLYIKFLANAYTNDSIFIKHQNDLQLFIGYAQTKKIPILVLVFPFLHNIELSEKLYGYKLKSYLIKNSVAYIDVGSIVKDIPLEKRVINSNDGHATVLVNKLVGNEIYKQIYKTNFIKKQ